MTPREKGKAQIDRWFYKFGLAKKDLARKAKVATSTLTHITNDPGYVISEETAERIDTCVESEARQRVPEIQMEVVAMCHGPAYVDDHEARTKMVAVIKNYFADDRSGKMAKSADRLPFPTIVSSKPDGKLPLPVGVSAVLLKVDGPDSPFYLIAINAKDSAEERRALAHELAHLIAIVMAGLNSPDTPPNSSFLAL